MERMGKFVFVLWSLVFGRSPAVALLGSDYQQANDERPTTVLLSRQF
jgi:hypothetical protein